MPDVEVRLTRLRDHAEAPATFTVRSGNWTALRRALEQTIYDGATSLDGIKDDPAVEEWLLFSDGLINYGVTPAGAKLKLRGPVHALLASPRADPTWLRSFAARHDGEFVNLLETAAPAAAARLRARSVRVLRVDYSHLDVAEVYPESGTAVGDGPLIVSGIFRTSRAVTVQLHVGTSESNAHTIEVLAEAGEHSSPLAARGWAAAKIAQLSLDLAANRADIRRTSREFGIVTADTSLIVLETVADYVRYEITPPEELRSEWSAQRRAIAGARTKNNDLHLEQVVRDFQARVAWWEKSFPKDTPSSTKSAHWKDGAPSLSASSTPMPVASPAATGFSGNNKTDGEIIQLQAFTVSEAREGSALAIGATRSYAAAASRRGAPAEQAESTVERPAPTITLQRWSPNTGYLERLQRTPALRVYAVYLEERVRHQRTPGFFLDVANFFFERGEADTARRVLSNLAELELEDVALLRALAHRLAQTERPDLAQPLFERILALRPDEPQSHRDLALVCADLKRHQRAVDLLWEVVSRPWDRRFTGIEQIALGELNAIAATCGESLNLSRVDHRLRKNLPVETRVILTWDTNDCDIDLWVTDPNAERSFYSHPLTYQGGRMSRDLTAGYGPEEFMLRSPKPGTYRVHLDYFGDARQTALGPVTAQVRLITGFGTPDQKEKRLTVRLEDRKQNLEVGQFDVESPRVALSKSR